MVAIFKAVQLSRKHKFDLNVTELANSVYVITASLGVDCFAFKNADLTEYAKSVF